MRETGPARSLLGLQLVLGPSRFAMDRIGVSAMKFPARILAAIAAILLVFTACMSARAATPPAASTTASLPDDAQSGAAAADRSMASIEIPGPLRSFLRMAGISQEIAPSDVMPLLARNAFLYGYQVGRRTEYLVLADRYVHLARELQQLVGPDGNIRVTGYR